MNAKYLILFGVLWGTFCAAEDSWDKPAWGSLDTAAGGLDTAAKDSYDNPRLISKSRDSDCKYYYLHHYY